jgi:hypothetical protein
MRTAPRAAAWAVWAVWICNRAIAGGAAAGNDWLQSRKSGLRPALFVYAAFTHRKPFLERFQWPWTPRWDKKHLAGRHRPAGRKPRRRSIEERS